MIVERGRDSTHSAKVESTTMSIREVAVSLVVPSICEWV